MKKFIHQLCIIVFALFTNTAICQFSEGKMVVAISVVNAPLEIQGMASMFNMNMNMYFKGKKTYMNMDIPTVGEVIALVDSAKKEMVICSSASGEKIAMVGSLDQIETLGSNEIDFSSGIFQLTDGEKVVAGHPCKKAIWTGMVNAAESQIEMWYATNIPNLISNYRGLPGAAMEYQFSVNGITMQYLVTAMTDEKVSSKKFKIPKGYKRMSMGELEKQREELGE